MDILSNQQTDESSSEENLDCQNQNERRYSNEVENGGQNIIIQNQLIRRSQRKKQERKWLSDMYLYYTEYTNNNEPISVKESVSSPNSKQWLEATKKGFDSLVQNETWLLVDKPTSEKIVKNKWAFKNTFGADGITINYKAKLVAKGYTQEYGIDYTETFAPVVRHSSIRLLFAIAAENDLDIDHLDVETAFLNGELEEEVYMEQAALFEEKLEENTVCLVEKGHNRT